MDPATTRKRGQSPAGGDGARTHNLNHDAAGSQPGSPRLGAAGRKWRWRSRSPRCFTTARTWLGIQLSRLSSPPPPLSSLPGPSRPSPRAAPARPPAGLSALPLPVIASWEGRGPRNRVVSPTPGSIPATKTTPEGGSCTHSLHNQLAGTPPGDRTPLWSGHRVEGPAHSKHGDEPGTGVTGSSRTRAWQSMAGTAAHDPWAGVRPE